MRVSYLTEQTSHHPPVSAFHISCPERGLTARGFDQITAKFTGTSIKVSPGEHNMGIFITLDHRDGETYQLTHPAAHLGGFLRGNLNVSVSEVAYITCPRTKLKTILSYVEEGWLGRTTNKVEGVIFRYDPDNDDKTRIRDVPDADVLARLSGPWREKVVLTLGPKPVVRFPSLPFLSSPLPVFSYNTKNACPKRKQTNISSKTIKASHPPEAQYTIIDVTPLSIAPKVLPPRDKQLPNESLALWSGVTDAILAKQFSKATTVKIELEEAQREKARKREADGEEWRPVFFGTVTGNGGQPELSEAGREVLRRAQEGRWDLEGLDLER